MAAPFALTPGQLALDDMRSLGEGLNVTLDPACYALVDKASAAVDAIITGEARVYGVNTGVGSLANQTISAEMASEMQRRLIVSHSAGTGPLLDDATVRRALIMKINILALGYSGMRREVIDALLTLYNADVLPCIPSKGSVGASGDLAPLAHMALILLGVGYARSGGEIISASEGLIRAGLEPTVFGAKEALCMINGTQISEALALRGLFAAENVFAAAVVAGSLSIDATLGSDVPFDARINEIRCQQGQIDIAATYRGLLSTSEIRDSHVNCERVQDPYSLRCQPQIMGACLDHMRFSAAIFDRELNAVTDNPLMFVDSGEVLSGGNFHAEPLAMAADTLALAIAETGALSERRIALMNDENFSHLPPFLVAEPGLNTGFMEAQVVAAALTSENKALAHPSSVDSLPTSANQEDHVSMATYAARRLSDMADNAAAIVAIELLAAAQGIEFRRPLTSSEILEEAHALIRAEVPALDQDRHFAPDLEAIKALVVAGAFNHMMPPGILPSLS